MTASTEDRTSMPTFAEGDFVALANAIDRVPDSERGLFLTKLVILLAAGAPAGVLANRIERAGQHLSA